MKIIEKILKTLAVCAGWVLGLLLIFGTSLKPIVYYQVLAASMALIVIYLFFIIEIGRKAE